jgi:hypothetical protein
MLHIQNANKLIDKRIIGGWVIKEINIHPTQSLYMFTLHCEGPLGNTIDKCSISLKRIGTSLQLIGQPSQLSYFFRYDGKDTNICGGADWFGDIDNFLTQIGLVIKSYHNKG